jgi:ABC-2 type transport system permease protein
MSAQTNVVPMKQAAAPTVAPAAQPVFRTFYWCLRRELWGSRSLYLAPVLVAVAALVAFLVSALAPSRDASAAVTASGLAGSYHTVAMALIPTMFIVGMAYCLEALRGERGDRSILFWKSLPVSDLTTVLAKASIPLLVLPLISFATIVVAQLVMLLASTVAGDGPLWRQVPVFRTWLLLLYTLPLFALWLAPFYCWAILISGWARRATLLWASLPPLVILAVERLAFDGSYVTSLLRYRLLGFFTEAFRLGAAPSEVASQVDTLDAAGAAFADPLLQMQPARFLSSPGLWVGLGVTGVLLTAAVWLRRHREPT